MLSRRETVTSIAGLLVVALASSWIWQQGLDDLDGSSIRGAVEAGAPSLAEPDRLQASVQRAAWRSVSAGAAATVDAADTCAALTGSVVREDGVPVPFAAVEILELAATAGVGGARRIRADASGQFRSGDLPVGRSFRVVARAPRLLGCLDYVTAGQVLRVVVRPARSLRLRVLDGDGVPVHDADVQLYRGHGGRLTDEARTDPFGLTRSLLTSGDRAVAWIQGRDIRSVRHEVDLRECDGSVVDVCCQRGVHALVGRVVEEASGDALSGVRVRELRTRREARTDPQGRFELGSYPEGANVTVAVECAGFLSSVRTFRSDVPSLVIRMRRGEPFRVVVTDVDGRPIAAAVVTKLAPFEERMSDGSWVQTEFRESAVADGQGVAILTRHERERATLQARAKGFVTIVHHGELQSLVPLRLAAQRVLTIGIDGGAPTEVTEWSVQITREHEDPAAALNAGSFHGCFGCNGEIQIADLQPAPHLVTLRRGYAYRESTTWDTAEKDGLRFRVPRGALTVRVTDAKGQPAAKNRVVAVSEDGRVTASATTNPHGEARLLVRAHTNYTVTGGARSVRVSLSQRQTLHIQNR